MEEATMNAIEVLILPVLLCYFILYEIISKSVQNTVDITRTSGYK